MHRVNPEDDNPYGTGLGLQLYWPVFFKRKGIVAWNKLNDRFGSPTPHGKYPRNASPKEKSTLVDALRAMSNDGYLATPEGMEVALLESKLSGNVTTQQQLCEYMDDWISEVLTGQEPSRASGGAVAAAAVERQNVRQDLTQADSDLLSETLNTTLVAWICELNGLAPCHVWRNIQEEQDQKALAEADKLVFDMGFDLSEDAARAKYGEGWSRRESALGPVPGPAAASFAEALRQPGMADQVALDAALQAMPAQQLQDDAQALLAPLMEQLQQAQAQDDPQALLGWLAEVFPGLDDSQLQERMARLLFAASVWGRLHGGA